MALTDPFGSSAMTVPRFENEDLEGGCLLLCDLAPTNGVTLMLG